MRDKDVIMKAMQQHQFETYDASEPLDREPLEVDQAVDQEPLEVDQEH